MKEYERLTKKDQDWFEFTEITDNEIYKRLQDLENKIENGTLIEILCKTGDKVYQFDNGGKIYESEIKSIHYASNTLFYDCEYFVFDKSVIGEIIFLTKAEAEAKLKELKEQK